MRRGASEDGGIAASPYSSQFNVSLRQPKIIDKSSQTGQNSNNMYITAPNITNNTNNNNANESR
jgi:hypothetical protein